MKFWQQWKYKNFTLTFISIIVTLVLSRIESFHLFLLHLGTLGFVGAFLAGILFTSTFTFATGALIIIILAEQLPPLQLGITAGLGAMVGDLTIFRFVKDNLVTELEEIYNHVDQKHHFTKLLHSKYFRWSLPVLGAIIIASPLPDELGVTLMGISKMKTYKFMIISFLLNSIGIFLIVSALAVLRK